MNGWMITWRLSIGRDQCKLLLTPVYWQSSLRLATSRWVCAFSETNIVQFETRSKQISRDSFPILFIESNVRTSLEPVCWRYSTICFLEMASELRSCGAQGGVISAIVIVKREAQWIKGNTPNISAQPNISSFYDQNLNPMDDFWLELDLVAPHKCEWGLFLFFLFWLWYDYD